MNRPLPRIRRSPIVLVALTVLLAIPLGVLASHTFGDVLNSNAFHNDIDAIAEAGVTTGCGGASLGDPADTMVAKVRCYDQNAPLANTDFHILVLQ